MITYRVARRVLFYFQAHSNFITGLFSLVLLFGCTSGDQPPLGEVEGHVTLDGKPLANAMIFFDPESKGRSSTAMTNENGDYELDYTVVEKGAKIGKHQIRITTFIAKGTESAFPEGRPELVPAKYLKGESLTGEVESGRNTIDLDLTSQ